MNECTADELPRLMNCNGSRLMPASFPLVDADITLRDEGTAAHWLAAQWFVEGPMPAGSKAPNGVIITDDMIDHIGEYIAALDCGEVEAVTSFGMPGEWRINGRCDHWKVNSENTLIVDDLKYGWRLVSPEMNWTLIAHACGLISNHQLPVSDVLLRIHQPRPYHPEGKVREWRITTLELSTYWQRIADTMANPSDMLNTGIEWCATCPALATCPAARAARMNIVDASALAFSDDVPNEALAYDLDTMRNAQAMIDAQVSALEELTKHRLRNGAVIDNYALTTQYGHTRWKTGITPEALTMVTGIDCVKPSAITPAEAKRRGLSETVYNSLTERPMTGTKLTRVTADQRAQQLLGKK